MTAPPTPTPGTKVVTPPRAETRPSYQTSELALTLATVAAILISAAISDILGARQAWLYVTILIAAYCIGRGLAKSGTNASFRDTRD